MYIKKKFMTEQILQHPLDKDFDSEIGTFKHDKLYFSSISLVTFEILYILIIIQKKKPEYFHGKKIIAPLSVSFQNV